MKNRRRLSNALLAAGALLLVVGGCLLLVTSGLLSGFSSLWPVLFVVAGLLLLYFAFTRKLTGLTVFPGMIMALGGLYFLLGEGFLPWRDLIRIWPVFMAIIGASITAYGLTKRGNARLSLVIPGIAILVLAAIFLPFSLGVTSVRFAQVAVLWWPALLVLFGLILLASYLLRRWREKT